MKSKERLIFMDNIGQASRFALQEDYAILYGCLEVAVSLLKERHISREDWSTSHGIIKSYLIDRSNRDKEDYTAYTDEIYSWCEDIFEEINKRRIRDE